MTCQRCNRLVWSCYQLVFITFFVLICLTSQSVINARTFASYDDKTTNSNNAPRQKLLLILADGFRWDYFRPNMKGFQRFFSEGVKAKYMIPDFPTISYPNYYSIATGLHVENHGMVDNWMYDTVANETFLIGESPHHLHPFWWQDGDPIWITAKRQNINSYMYWWPGCDVEIHGLRPDYCLPVLDAITAEELAMAVNATVEVFHNGSADFVALYYWNTDSVGHKYGPFSPELEKTLDLFDSEMFRLQQLLDKATVDVDRRQVSLSSLVNIIVVSDHGMTRMSSGEHPVQFIDVFQYIDRSQLIFQFLRGYVGQFWPHADQVQNVYNSLKASGVKGMKVYMKDDIPGRFFYKKHHRVAPVIIILDAYCTFDKNHTIIGNHGLDNKLSDMWSIFTAKGPAFKANYTKDGFSCIELYQVMCFILGITPSPHNGTWAHVVDMLADPAGPRDAPQNNVLLSLVAVGVIVAVVLVVVMAVKHTTCWERSYKRFNDVRYSAVVEDE